jgi:hypothetical protein
VGAAMLALEATGADAEAVARARAALSTSGSRIG